MHHSSAANLITFLALLLGLFSLPTASPSPLNHHHTPPNNASTIIRRENDGPEGGVYMQLPGDNQYEIANMPICNYNSKDQNMCTVGYQTSQGQSDAALWLFDHNCVQIGFNGGVALSDLATLTPTGWGFSSDLPDYVLVQVLGDPMWNPAVTICYGTGPEPGCRMPLIDPEFIAWAQEFSSLNYFSFVAPFTC